MNFKQGTQKQILYDYLQSGKTITTRTAMINLGIGDLQSVIRHLKKSGISIYTKDIKVPTRYNNKDGSTKMSSVREYSLDVFEYETAEDFAIWN